ncbi:MAG: transcription termination/antitermination NusG family protein [Candidatus Bipolaricaulaceae bacterium]
MQRKKWYAIQTYAGSELRVKRQLEERVRQLEWERYFEPIHQEDDTEYFFVPVEEVITSRSRRGRSTEYRIPYEYELFVKSNQRVQRGDLVGRRPPRHLERAARVVSIEQLWRVVVELTNRSEVEYLVPQEKGLRRDIRIGERVRTGIPLTPDADEHYLIDVKGQVVARERVRRITLEYEDGSQERRIIPEAYVPTRLREGSELAAGEEIEREHKIYSRATGLVKVKEYKDKRVITVQRIEKRRLIPGYVFAKMGLEEEQMSELIRGLEGSVRFVGTRARPSPIEGREMNLIQRKAGLEEAPAAEPRAKAPKVEVEFEVGEVVQIVEGPFADFTGEIKEIDKEAEEVVVMVKIFGRETPVRVGFDGVDRV